MGTGELASLEERLERSSKLLSEERFDVVLAESADLLEASDAVVGHVQELQNTITIMPDRERRMNA